MLTLRKHRFVFLFMSLSTIFVALAPLFLIASCHTLQQTPQELKARETLRAMTRGGVLPAEDAVVRIESDFPKTTPGSVAKMVHARIKLNAKDFAGAAALLDSSAIRDYTPIGDYALWLRAGALEQANRRVEARATYEQLARDYPSSLRAREATLRDAQMFMQDGQAAGVPVALKQLAAKDDAAALLLTAKAYEQTGDSTRTLAAYRRIYFFAPASADAQEAATALTGLNSALSPTTAEEAISRAEKLSAAKRFSEAFDAYTEAFVRFPTSATPELQARRAIAAANARRYADATAALTAQPRPRLPAKRALKQCSISLWLMAARNSGPRRAAWQTNFTAPFLTASGQLGRLCNWANEPKKLRTTSTRVISIAPPLTSIPVRRKSRSPSFTSPGRRTKRR